MDISSDQRSRDVGGRYVNSIIIGMPILLLLLFVSILLFHRL